MSIQQNAVYYTCCGDMKMYNRIKDLREDHDLTQKQISKILNCSQVCCSRYEKGQRDIPLKALCKLSEFYNVSVDYILGLTDNPKMNR